MNKPIEEELKEKIADIWWPMKGDWDDVYEAALESTTDLIRTCESAAVAEALKKLANLIWKKVTDISNFPTGARTPRAIKVVISGCLREVRSCYAEKGTDGQTD